MRERKCRALPLVMALSTTACSAAVTSSAPPVVQIDPEPIESNRTPVAQPTSPRCVVRGDVLGMGVPLLPPQGGDGPWARMRGHVAGRFRLDVTASVEGRAPLSVDTDTIRLDGVADATSLEVYAREALHFGALVTSEAGHSFSWTRSGAERLRLRLDLGRGMRPKSLFREVRCEEVRLGGVDHVGSEKPSGFEDRGQIIGAGMLPLLPRPGAADATLRIDASAGLVVDLGRTSKGHREIYFDVAGYAVRAWVPDESIGPVPVLDSLALGVGGGRGNLGITTASNPKLTLTCPHEVPIHAVRGELSFSAATMKPGPKIQVYSRDAVAPGLFPVTVHSLPLSLVGGYQLAVERDVLEGCKPPPDDDDIPF